MRGSQGRAGPPPSDFFQPSSPFAAPRSRAAADSNYPSENFDSRSTITFPMLRDVVSEAAQRFGDTAALVDGDGRPVSYRDLHLRSDAVAAGLARRGLSPGDVVGLRLPAGPEYVVAYL